MKYVEKIRKETGLTIEVISDLLMTTTSQVAMWDNGERPLKGEQINLLILLNSFLPSNTGASGLPLAQKEIAEQEALAAKAIDLAETVRFLKLRSRRKKLKVMKEHYERHLNLLQMSRSLRASLDPSDSKNEFLLKWLDRAELMAIVGLNSHELGKIKVLEWEIRQLETL